MTDAQLYTAIGVPILALIFAMVTNFALISRVDKRIDELGAGLNARIDQLGAGLNARIDDTKEILRAEMQRDHSEVMAKFAEMGRRLDRLESERRVIQ